MGSGVIAAILAPIIGAAAAFAASFTLATVNNAAPDSNPASQQMLTYGE
jgi:hypothetical protein